MPKPTDPRVYDIRFTNLGEQMLKDLKRRRGRQVYEQLRDLILELRANPVEQTKPLTSLLRDFRSLHSGRFRVVVRVVESVVQVRVVGVGWHSSGERDDIYQILQRLAARKKLDP